MNICALSEDKILYSVSSFIMARNEEDNIGRTIDSLKNQTHDVHPIVVVDDGSVDATPTIAVEKGCQLVRLPYHEESHVGRPELANVRNAGLTRIKEHGIPDFVLQMGADHILSDNYVESILSRMGTNVKVASGATQIERLNVNTPWGSGRLIDARLWNAINGMRYPVKWGHESWIIYKVKQLGYEVRRYDDVASFTRPVRMYPDKAFKWGKCSYAIGCSLPFALIKAFGMGTDGLHFMKGYFSRKDVEKHEDIAKFVKKQQYERGLSKIKGIINRVSRGADKSSLTRWNNS